MSTQHLACGLVSSTTSLAPNARRPQGLARSSFLSGGPWAPPTHLTLGPASYMRSCTSDLGKLAGWAVPGAILSLFWKGF